MKIFIVPEVLLLHFCYLLIFRLFGKDSMESLLSHLQFVPVWLHNSSLVILFGLGKVIFLIILLFIHLFLTSRSSSTISSEKQHRQKLFSFFRAMSKCFIQPLLFDFILLGLLLVISSARISLQADLWKNNLTNLCLNPLHHGCVMRESRIYKSKF